MIDALDPVAAVLLVAALLANGLQAGTYYAWASGVMPGLARADDATFVATMRHVNVAIVNPVFLASFLGAPLLTAVAVLAVDFDALAWTAAALVLALATVGITAAGNVPLNDALETDGDRRPPSSGPGCAGPCAHPDLRRRPGLPGDRSLPLTRRSWAAESPSRAGRGSARSKSRSPAVHSAPTRHRPAHAPKVITSPMMPPTLWVAGGSPVVTTTVSAPRRRSPRPRSAVVAAGDLVPRRQPGDAPVALVGPGRRRAAR